MCDHPEGLALLQLAETTMREQVLPALGEDKRYVALMILKALSIAERQLTSDEGALERQRDTLEGLLGQMQRSSDLHAQVCALQRQLARQVRVGAHDDHGAVRRVLWDLTCQRVRESAPRYLESEGIE